MKRALFINYFEDQVLPLYAPVCDDQTVLKHRLIGVFTACTHHTTLDIFSHNKADMLFIWAADF